RDHSARLLRIGLKPSEQADRALLRRTTISIAQPFEGPKDVTASVPRAVARRRRRYCCSPACNIRAAGQHRARRAWPRSARGRRTRYPREGGPGRCRWRCPPQNESRTARRCWIRLRGEVSIAVSGVAESSACSWKQKPEAAAVQFLPKP